MNWKRCEKISLWPDFILCPIMMENHYRHKTG